MFEQNHERFGDLNNNASVEQAALKLADELAKANIGVPRKSSVFLP